MQSQSENMENVPTGNEPTENVPTENKPTENVQTKGVDAIKFVANQAQDVSINMSGITEIAMEVITYMVRNYENLNFGEVTSRYVRLSSGFHPKPNDLRAADWLFVLNTLNFALWTRKDEQEWKVHGLTGYMGLCTAIKRAIDDGKPMWSPMFYKDLSMTDMKNIFRGDDNNYIPRISERLEILHDIGEILLDSYKGTFSECIRLCEHDAAKLLLILKKFPSYDDSLTKYGEQPDGLLTHGSREELEIFCCSIIIARYVKKMVMDMCEIYTEQDKIPEICLPSFDCMCLVDNFLWDYRQVHDMELKKSILCKISTDQY
ncbi:queuosine 5'-phosphate N-glycosylase/hydrolase-like isoform X2 [Temnothorax nylanderi]|uniref:queuosine 5'-phosphate N-glycosylase/hydrolase-like isoform X2 n=1 Tax=Temnothorax nylanderi TaxID=102681 RepID=UPI003A8A69AD